MQSLVTLASSSNGGQLPSFGTLPADIIDSEVWKYLSPELEIRIARALEDSIHETSSNMQITAKLLIEDLSSHKHDRMLLRILLLVSLAFHLGKYILAMSSRA
jgi:hypothetical protein